MSILLLFYLVDIKLLISCFVTNHIQNIDIHYFAKNIIRCKKKKMNVSTPYIRIYVYFKYDVCLVKI